MLNSLVFFVFGTPDDKADDVGWHHGANDRWKH